MNNRMIVFILFVVACGQIKTVANNAHPAAQPHSQQKAVPLLENNRSLVSNKSTGKGIVNSVGNSGLAVGQILKVPLAPIKSVKNPITTVHGFMQPLIKTALKPFKQANIGTKLFKRKSVKDAMNEAIEKTGEGFLNKQNVKTSSLVSDPKKEAGSPIAPQLKNEQIQATPQPSNAPSDLNNQPKTISPARQKAIEQGAEKAYVESRIEDLQKEASYTKERTNEFNEDIKNFTKDTDKKTIEQTHTARDRFAKQLKSYELELEKYREELNARWPQPSNAPSDLNNQPKIISPARRKAIEQGNEKPYLERGIKEAGDIISRAENMIKMLKEEIKNAPANTPPKEIKKKESQINQQNLIINIHKPIFETYSFELSSRWPEKTKSNA